MSKIDFPLWLQEQISTREWKPTDLAKRSRISDTAVSRILRGERKADTETLLSFAHALNVSPITIFRKAGLLPNGNGDEIRFEDWEHLLKQMTPEDEAELRQIAELKIERRKKDQSLKLLKPKKAG